MKKENVTISFESEQLAALEFSLKKKNASVQAQLEELLKCLYESEGISAERLKGKIDYEYCNKNNHAGA